MFHFRPSIVLGAPFTIILFYYCSIIWFIIIIYIDFDTLWPTNTIKIFILHFLRYLTDDKSSILFTKWLWANGNQFGSALILKNYIDLIFIHQPETQLRVIFIELCVFLDMSAGMFFDQVYMLFFESFFYQRNYTLTIIIQEGVVIFLQIIE